MNLQPRTNTAAPAAIAVVFFSSCHVDVAEATKISYGTHRIRLARRQSPSWDEAWSPLYSNHAGTGASAPNLPAACPDIRQTASLDALVCDPFTAEEGREPS
jgi:hypothetical protein